MDHRAIELLYDSEATLRLVDHELDALREFTAGVDAIHAPAAVPSDAGDAARHPDDAADDLADDPAASLAMVPMILQRANTEIVGVLQSLRQCRTQLESATVDKLQITHEKLREVTSATESAATDILDGLDRARALVDELDADADASGQRSPRGDALRDRLRDELFVITGCLQFQDITNQQLAYASSMLLDMEARLGDIARLFDPRRYGAPELPPAPPVPEPTFSPDATCEGAEERQRLADQIFTSTPRTA
jgi:hypothetical protein